MIKLSKKVKNSHKSRNYIDSIKGSSPLSENIDNRIENLKEKMTPKRSILPQIKSPANKIKNPDVISELDHYFFSSRNGSS